MSRPRRSSAEAMERSVKKRSSVSTNSALDVHVIPENGAIQATVTERRADVVTTLVSLNEAQRHAFVTDAWTIGVRAIMNAHRNADEARLADVGKSMVEDLDRELEGYVASRKSGGDRPEILAGGS